MSLEEAFVAFKQELRKKFPHDPARRSREREGWRYANDPAYRERKKEIVRKQRIERADDPDYQKMQQRWRQTERERRQKKYATDLAYRERMKAEGREYGRRRHAEGRAYKKRHGVTREIYEQMFLAQGGVCAICKEPETTVQRTGKVQRLSVDHCHATGKVRGLLCSWCNPALGGARDSIRILRAMIDYLKRAKA